MSGIIIGKMFICSFAKKKSYTQKGIVKSETHQTTPNAPYPIGRSGCTS
jgi:hypothetical protein